MAELVDALVSGTSGREVVGVRVPFWAPIYYSSAVSPAGVKRYAVCTHGFCVECRSECFIVAFLVQGFVSHV